MAEYRQSISQWHHHLEWVQQSTQEFYEAIEAAVIKRKVTDAKFARVHYRENTILSAKREYLRIKRGELSFDICGAPFANGFFVSWRLFEEGSFIDRTPVLRTWGRFFFKPRTFYKLDTTLMYQQLVHASVMDVVDTISKMANMPVLPETERKPVMREFYR